MTMLNESMKFRDAAKEVMHCRPLATELKLAEPFTDVTIESFNAFMAKFVLLDHGGYQPVGTAPMLDMDAFKNDSMTDFKEFLVKQKEKLQTIPEIQIVRVSGEYKAFLGLVFFRCACKYYVLYQCFATGL